MDSNKYEEDFSPIIDAETLEALRKDIEDNEAFENDFEDIDFEELKKEIEATDPLDLEPLVGLDTDEEGRAYFPSIRGVTIKPNKYYRDENKTPRIDFTFKSEDRGRTEAILYMTPTEKYLSEIIDELPYGLIDKQVTGIGATHLEMYSKRNSIIVLPTRVLAKSKASKEPRFLYVGTKEDGKVTSDREIEDYFNNHQNEDKKLLVVADSLRRVIKVIQSTGEDVYRDYFLMVDEIDTLQSDNHFRPQLSIVIDYYFKFKLQRKALVSATVSEFSHSDLQKIPLTIIKRDPPIPRDIELIHTNNINLTLAKRIEQIAKTSSEKILIAYNSIDNILATIHLLSEKLQPECGVLCSEASHDKINSSQRATLNKEDKLSHRITFMTCAFFTGIDIEEEYHLITVSDANKGYSILPFNRLVQIHGRCRVKNGLLSDIIIYNTAKQNNKPFNYNSYREILMNKAEKVITLLKAADKIKENDSDLTDLFDRIKKVIMERACENFLGTDIELTRENIDNELEVSYFNIDSLCEKMKAYCELYSDKKNLYKELEDKGHRIIKFTPAKEIEPKEKKEDAEAKEGRIDSQIQECIHEINNLLNNNALNDENLDYLIRRAKRESAEFYRRFKAHYMYYDAHYLTEALKDVAHENKKSYRGLNNALSFMALDEHHPFKMQTHNAFKTGQKYSSEEIHGLLSVIIKDQFFKTLDITQNRCVGHFNNFVDSKREWKWIGNERVTVYLVEGYNPRELQEPLKKIPKESPATNYFEI